MITRHRNQGNLSNQMGSLLFPDIKKPQPLKQNRFHKDNINQLRVREQQMQDQFIQKNMQQPEWKMQKFKQVDSKVQVHMGGGQRPRANHMVNQKENINQGPSAAAPLAGKAMTKAQEMKLRLAAPPKMVDHALRLSANNLNNLQKQSQPIQMERGSPPQRNFQQEHRPDQYIGNIQPVQQIQKQISQESYGHQPAPQKNNKKDENIFDLVNQRGNSQNSIRGISLERERNQNQNHQKQVKAEKPVQMEIVPEKNKPQVKNLKRNESLTKNNRIKDNMERVIQDNAQAIKVRQKNQQREDDKTRLQQHKNYGKVPKYINKYNAQREEVEINKMIEFEKAKMPPGTRLMGEQERQETLVDLHESKKEINSALEKLPVVSKTIQMTKHKKDLEGKLAQIEKAIETFSKKTVYVAF